MKKITTLFKKDPNDLSRVINDVSPENEWVFKTGIPTRKFDGTACTIINGNLYKRFDLKKGRKLPANAIPCQEPDKITGHHPHWVKCDRSNPADKYHFEGFDTLANKRDGTYELCGEKVQGNPENRKGHSLLLHGNIRYFFKDFSFENLKYILKNTDIEGIVFHDSVSDKMCKIRKSDFGFKR